MAQILDSVAFSEAIVLFGDAPRNGPKNQWVDLPKVSHALQNTEREMGFLLANDVV